MCEPGRYIIYRTKDGRFQYEYVGEAYVQKAFRGNESLLPTPDTEPLRRRELRYDEEILASIQCSWIFIVLIGVAFVAFLLFRRSPIVPKVAAAVVLVWSVLSSIVAAVSTGADLLLVSGPQPPFLAYLFPLLACFLIGLGIGVCRGKERCRLWLGFCSLIAFSIMLLVPLGREFEYHPSYIAALLFCGLSFFLLWFYSPLRRYSQRISTTKTEQLAN